MTGALVFACLVALVATVGVEVAVVVAVGVEIIKKVHLAEELLIVVVAEVALNGEGGKLENLVNTTFLSLQRGRRSQENNETTHSRLYETLW